MAGSDVRQTEAQGAGDRGSGVGPKVIIIN